MKKSLEKEKMWFERIEKYKNSEFSMKQYCVKNDLIFTTFRYWASKYNKKNNTFTDKTNKSSWTKLEEISSTNKSSAFKVKIYSATIEVNENFDLITFENIIKVLKKLC
ncbi:IS66 family insertion sequence element accessory protein TnpA [Helicovermis profundi]|uniref:Transposase n=1 Tax=Helicovermis profundi TaxID=3065157 RepID=A0AAU9EBW8_9FIRM|nr:hypothetical protein HLPR_26680 [Clostridia bacterium S502]